MIFVLISFFAGCCLSANHRVDPAALALSPHELLSVQSVTRQAIPAVVAVDKDLDVIGVCKSRLMCANYHDNPDALVMHNVVLDRPFLVATTRKVETQQAHDSSEIISEQELTTFIRHLHTDDAREAA